MKRARARTPTKRLGRRAGPTGASRDAILQQARALFAQLGFRGTTMRAVAKRAGVDVALVHYFFGSKPKLFAASVAPPIDPARLTTLLGERSGKRGATMARYYLEHLFVERREPITAMLRAGIGDPGCVPALRALIEKTLVTAAAGTLNSKDARLRAELVGAQMVGLFVTRCIVGVEPLATASVDQLVGLLGPALEQLLGPGSSGAPDLGDP